MMKLSDIQQKLLNAFIGLAPIGDILRVTHKTAGYSMDTSTYAWSLKKLVEGGYIERIEDRPGTNIRVLKRYNPEDIAPTLGAEHERVLSYLILNYGIGNLTTVEKITLADGLHFENPASVTTYLNKLADIGAVTFEKKMHSLTFTVLKRPEEFLQAKPRRRAPPKNATKEGEVIRLLEEIRELKARISSLQMRKPVAWLWMKKGEAKWRGVVHEVPTKEDTKTLTFCPLFTEPTELFEETSKYKHLKSEGLYYFISTATDEETMAEKVVYRSVELGLNWIRDVGIFHDGRFVDIRSDELVNAKAEMEEI